MAYTKSEIESAREKLREWIAPGDTIYTILRHVSKSGMYRAIDVLLIKDNSPSWISRYVARALDCRFDEKYEAVGVKGCGMDMGFHIVNELSYALHGWDRPDRPLDPVAKEKGLRSGYTLNHRWL